MTKRLYLIAAVFILSFCVFSPLNEAQAREDFFRPASGNITDEFPGDEKAVVTAEGTLNAYNAKGVMLAGFPVKLENKTFNSSPLLIDIAGTGEKEIVVFARTSEINYSVYAFDSQGNVVADKQNPIPPAAFDPIAFQFQNKNKSEVLYSSVTGRIWRLSYDNGSFFGAAVASFPDSEIVGVQVGSSINELIINFPTRNKLAIYSEVGGFHESKSLVVAHPVSFPVLSGGNDVIYGVDNDQNLIAINKNTGEAIAGFPKKLSGSAVDSPFFSEFDANAQGIKIAVSLSNGKTDVFDLAGAVVAEKPEQKSLLEKSTTTTNQNSQGFFSAVGNYGSSVGNGIVQNIKSIWSLIHRQLAVFLNDAQIQVTLNGGEIVSDSSHDFGAVNTQESVSLDYKMKNTGSGELFLTGSNSVNLTGANAADFTIEKYPAINLISGAETQFTVAFKPLTGGAKEAVLEIASNDESTALFTIKLTGRSSEVLKMYEDAENGNTAGWSLYFPQYVFGTITNELEDEIHGRVIQLTQTKNGATYYRLRNDDQTEWNDTTGKIFEWDMKTNSETVVYVYVTTNKGLRRVIYSFDRDPNKFTGIDAEFNLNPSFKDGLWHSYARNLEQDLKKLDNTLTITKVNYMMIGALPVGKNIQLNNILLAADAGFQHTISGTVLDAEGQPTPGFRLGLMPDNITQKTDASGKFYFSSLQSGTYQIKSQSAQFEFDPKEREVVVSDSNVSDIILSSKLQDNIVYEDGEDETTIGWELYYPTWVYGTITNVLDEDPAHGRAIQLTQTVNAATYYRLMNEKSLDWDNSTSKILKWDMKTDSETVIYVYTMTNKGLRRAIYSFNRDPNKYTGQDAEFNLNPAFKDGQWHSFSRNLEQDLKKYDSELVLTKINYMMMGSFPVGKGARFDNIIAIKEDNSVHTASGTFVDELGAPVANIKATLLPDGISITSKADGKFAFTSLPNGNYTLRIDTPHYSVISGADIAINGADQSGLNVVTPFANALVYENAEDGLTTGWSLHYPQNQNGTIANVSDDDPLRNKAIELTQTVSGSQFFKFASDTGADWNNPSGKILSWDMKTGTEMTLYAIVATNKGNKRAIYSFTKAASFNGTDAYFNIGANLKDGAWHNFVRDLDADMKSVDPTINVSGLKSISLAASAVNKPARIDNIRVLVNQESAQ